MSTTLRRKICNLSSLVMAILLPFGLFACAPKGPSFSGRFLYYPVDCGTDNQLSILEFKTGMESPSLLWKAIACQPHSNELGFSISSDGHYAMLISDAPYNTSTPPYFNLLILDLTSGEYKKMPAPEYTAMQVSQMKASGAFSPDNRYFAYTVNSYHNGLNRLYLMEMASGKNSILFDSPCAQYSLRGFGMGGSTFCATVGLPQWLDDTTLVFSGYSGEMPLAIQLGNDIDPNHTFVMNLDGTILQNFTPALYVGGVFGQTLLYYEYGKSAEGYKWLETVELKQGKINAHALDIASQFRAGKFLELPSISPDGQYAFQRIGDIWHLIGLRTGSDTEIRSTGVKTCYYFLWSPDQKNILCSDDDAIISLEGYADQRIPNPTGLTRFAWLP